jgi:hypothetical protein
VIVADTFLEGFDEHATVTEHEEGKARRNPSATRMKRSNERSDSKATFEKKAAVTHRT